MLKKLINKIFGQVEYHVQSVNSPGQVNRSIVYSKKELNKLIDDVNKDTYFNVQSIKKYRKFNYKYNGMVRHTPLWFSLDNVTTVKEMVGIEYRVLIPDESLTNIEYGWEYSTKEEMNE